MTTEPELEEAVDAIRAEYARRAIAPQCIGQYSLLNPAHAALVFEREQALLAALGRHLHTSLSETDILDVGCSSGISLGLLAVYGADPARLHGVDIDPGRIAAGHRTFPAFDLRVSDGHSLPFGDSSFDVVLQITMLSSVHSPALRERLCAEMARVVRPGGLVVSYDIASVPLVPRLLNRGLRLLDLGRRRPPAAAAVATGSEAPPVSLTPVEPLSEPLLRALFAGFEPVAAGRLTPYRPLVERAVHRRLLRALVFELPGLSSAFLFVARRPA